VLSVQVVRLERRARLLIIRRSWVRAPPAPPFLTCKDSPNASCAGSAFSTRRTQNVRMLSWCCLPRLPDQRCRLLGGGQVRLDQHMGLPVVDVLAGVPSALVQLDDGYACCAASFLNRLDT
jgi:hypothetical protein